MEGINNKFIYCLFATIAITTATAFTHERNINYICKHFMFGKNMDT